MSTTRARLEAYKNNTGPYGGTPRSKGFARVLTVVDGMLLELERGDRAAGHHERAGRLYRLRLALSRV